MRHNDNKKDKYAILNKHNHDHQIQFYMYTLMYVDIKTIPEEN